MANLRLTENVPKSKFFSQNNYLFGLKVNLVSLYSRNKNDQKYTKEVVVIEFGKH